MGTEDAVGYISSHFFAEPTMLLATERRGGPTMERRTYAVASPIPQADVYVLTGPGSASGAESIAFGLKRTGRATLVGETTAGAGHWGGPWRPVDKPAHMTDPAFEQCASGQLYASADGRKCRCYHPFGNPPGYSRETPCPPCADEMARAWRRQQPLVTRVAGTVPGAWHKIQQGISRLFSRARRTRR